MIWRKKKSNNLFLDTELETRKQINLNSQENAARELLKLQEKEQIQKLYDKEALTGALKAFQVKAKIVGHTGFDEASWDQASWFLEPVIVFNGSPAVCVGHFEFSLYSKLPAEIC